MPTKDTDKAKTPEAKAAEAEAARTRAQDPEPTPAPTQPPAAASDAAAEQRGAEREFQRQDEIRTMVRVARLDPSVADELIKDKSTVEAAREAVFKRMAERAGDPVHNHVLLGEQERDKVLARMSDWVIAKAGRADLVQAHTKKDVDPAHFRGMTMLDLARECLERSGVRTRGMDKMTLVGTAFTHRSGITQSTSDFAVLLETAFHKVLLAQYGTTPDTWSRFCMQGTISDFRAHPRYRMGTFGSLDAVNENGEIKEKKIPDGAKESITGKTVGNIVNLSRKAIINDDMGAFNRIAAMAGRAAKLTIEVDVYATLALNAGLGPTMNDGNTLFHASHNNISTGAALSAAAIDADRVQMGQQTDPSGNEYLDLRPNVLLVPLSLGGTARVINDSQYDPDTVANKAQMKPNLVRGLFRDVVDTPRITGTRRYLFADPGVAPTIEVAFLDGQTQPFLETQQGWRVDGVEWRIRLDYAVGGIDYRGAVTNAGA